SVLHEYQKCPTRGESNCGKCVPFAYCNASSRGLRAPDRAVWGGAGFYHQIRVYSADPRMNTCSAAPVVQIELKAESSMKYQVVTRTVSSQTLAAVRRHVRIGNVGRAWKPALDLVWEFLRRQEGLRTDGHHCYLYPHP